MRGLTFIHNGNTIQYAQTLRAASYMISGSHVEPCLILCGLI